MEKELFFETSYMARYPLGLHSEYQRTMYGAVSQCGLAPGRLHIKPSLFVEWMEKIELENQIGRVVRKFTDTQRMKDLDKRRDTLIGYIFNRFRNATNSPIAEEQVAGVELSPVANTYVGLQREGALEESALVRGLLADLRSEKYAALVVVLLRPAVLDKLESLNNAYSEMYDRRQAALAARHLPLAKTVRAECDAILGRVLFCIQAAYLLDERVEDKPALESLAHLLNTITRDFRTRYYQGVKHRTPSLNAPAPQE